MFFARIAMNRHQRNVPSDFHVVSCDALHDSRRESLQVQDRATREHEVLIRIEIYPRRLGTAPTCEIVLRVRLAVFAEPRDSICEATILRHSGQHEKSPASVER